MAEPGAEKLNPQTHDPDHTGCPSRRRRRCRSPPGRWRRCRSPPRRWRRCRSPPRRWRWLSPPGRWRWRSPPRGWRRIGSWTRRGRSGRAGLTRRRRWGRRIGVRDWRAHPDQSHPQTGCHGRAGEHLLDRHHELLALMVSGPDSAASGWRWLGCTGWCGGGGEARLRRQRRCDGGPTRRRGRERGPNRRRWRWWFPCPRWRRSGAPARWWWRRAPSRRRRAGAGARGRR